MAIMADNLTLVSITWRKRRRHHRLLFGTPYRWIRLDWRRRLAAFQPGQIFGYERWQANRYGTQTWQVFVVVARAPNERASDIPGVRPGADLLLSAYGKAASKRALTLFDQLSEVTQLDALSEGSWRQAGTLFATKLDPLTPLILEANYAPRA